MKRNITKQEQVCIDCMVKNFANKWLNCTIYEKCLRKFHVSTIRFEQHVRVEFKGGYVKIVRQEEMGVTEPLCWYWQNEKLSTNS
jgi:hypothetical protein